MGIGIIKKLLFCSYFWHIFLCFYSNFDRESSFDVELNFASNKYPLGILLMDHATPKTRNTWKNVMMMSSSCFFSYLFLGGSTVHQNYAVWVIIGCGIKFHIQRALPLRIRVKTQGDMSKIRTQKVVFFFLPPKLINIILLF